MGDVIDLTQLAVFRRRKAGETRQAILRLGAPARFDEDGVTVLAEATPPLVVEFIVPDTMKLAECEAAAQEAMAAIRQSPGFMTRYGFGDRALTDQQMLALARVISAVESACVLWTDWNFAEEVDGAAPVKRKLGPVAVAELLGDTDIRAAWMFHLDAASPLERAEGNVSGSSPNTNTGGEPDTVVTAE